MKRPGINSNEVASPYFAAVVFSLSRNTLSRGRGQQVPMVTTEAKRKIAHRDRLSAGSMTRACHSGSHPSALAVYTSAGLAPVS